MGSFNCTFSGILVARRGRLSISEEGEICKSCTECMCLCVLFLKKKTHFIALSSLMAQQIFSILYRIINVHIIRVH